MLEQQVGRYEKRIAEEERLASTAISSDAAIAHRQVAMIYKTELAILRGRRKVTVGEMLAETW
jgi:mannitol/fructose-specific phosphotransferase system IIA component (Ntr-type)